MRKVSYGRIVYVEPNDLASSTSDTFSLDNISWNPEELNMWVDLQVIVPRRSDFGSRNSSSGKKTSIELWTEGMDDVNRYISFMQGSDIKDKQGNLVGHELTTDYINASYTEITSQGQSCKEALGIDSIDITFDQHFYPQVNIKFIDVRGYSLMMPTEEVYRLEHTGDDGSSRLNKGGYVNFFRALFHFPYPRFLLTVKGFYGTSVTFQLAVNEFKNNFNSDTGNFEITVSFIGYMYGLYTDVPLNLLIAAPYYGHDKDGTCEKWNNVNFKYDNGGGSGDKPIYTLVEFLEQCNKLNDAITETKNNSTNLTTLAQANQNSAKIRALRELKKDLKNYIKATLIKQNRSNTDTYIVASDGFDVVWFKTDDDEDSKFNVDIVKWNIFATSWNKYIETDNLATPLWQPGGDLSGDENKYYSQVSDENEAQNYYGSFYEKDTRTVLGDGSITAIESTTANGGVTIADIKEHNQELQKKILRSEFCEKNVYCIMGSFVTKIIDDRIAEIQEEQKSIQPDVKEELKKLYEENLGFNPSVLNIYRMLFAHLDCFMQEFYEVAERITSNTEKRKLGNFGIDKEYMDVSSYMSEDAIVPPFPAIYQDDADGRRVQIYPGEISDLIDKMPELELVEGLLKATLGAKDRARKIICDQKERSTYNGENEAANNANDYTFTPTAVSDFKHKLHPYTTVPLTDAMNLILCMMSRVLSSKLQLYLSGDKLQDISDTESKNFSSTEVENFINLHPKTVGQKIKEELNGITTKINSGDKSVYKDFAEAWNRQHLNKVEYKDGKFKFYTNNAPICSEAYPPHKTNSVIIGSDGYAPLDSHMSFSTEMRADNRFSDIINFDKSIENGSGGKIIKKVVRGRIYTTLTRNGKQKETPRYMGDEKDLPKILDIEGCEVKNSNSDFPLNGISNSNGKVFCEKFPDDKNRAGLFLLYFNAYVYGANIAESTFYSLNGSGVKSSYSSKGIDTRNAEVIIPDLSNTTIGTMTYPAACLLGYMLKNGIDTPIISVDKNGKSTVKFVVAKNTNDILSDEATAIVYSRIYNNEELKNNLIKIFDTFATSTAWRDIRIGLTNNGKDITDEKEGYYKKDGGDDVYLMTNKLSRLLRDKMFGKVYLNSSSEKDMAIYVVNNEVKYDNKAFIEISEEEFSLIPKMLDTHYNQEQTEYERTDPHFDKSDINNAYRLALYNSLKNLYDKWANSYQVSDFMLRSPEDDRNVKSARFQRGEKNDGKTCEFDNFMFVDCFYNDISDIFRMNPLIISDVISKHVQAECNYSLYETMAEIMQKNRMLLLALPVYCNFYNFEEIDKLFTPNPRASMSKDLSSTYVGMYTYEVSHVVDDDRFDDHLDSDYFMIADLNGVADDPRPNPIGEQLFGTYRDDCLKIPVPAFGVTYARQNQSYFKRIDVNMDNPRVTDYSIYNMFLLTNSVEGNELNRPVTVANDIYSIYANRSYNCSVEMLGCANIMPMMYFQLNNIPMFRGAYMISNVEHHISAGEFTTKFSGVRISKNQLPYNTNIFDYDGEFNIDELASGLTESPVPYDENYNNINYRIPRDCDWDPRAAIRMMYFSRNYLNGSDRGSIDTLFSNKGGTAPLPNGSMKGGCASAVKTFIKAGFAQIALDSSRSKEQRDKARERANNAPGLFTNGWDLHKENAVQEMAKCGFERVYRTKATTKEGMNKELKEFGLKDGDILTTLLGDRTNWGHVHMWNSDIQKWVSDGPSQNAYVYDEKGGYHKKKKINYGPMQPDCGWLFRYVGCDTSKVQIVAANIRSNNVNNVGNPLYATGETKENAMKVINALMNTLGLTKEQSAGVAGALTAESGVNPRKFNKKEKNGTYKKSRANNLGEPYGNDHCPWSYGAGICQWTFTQRKEDAIMGGLGVTREQAKQKIINEGVESLSIDNQIAMLINELKTTFKETLIGVRKCNTAEKSAATYYCHCLAGVSKSTEPATRAEIDKMNNLYGTVGADSTITKGMKYAKGYVS